jgi:hypothetical protein
LGGARFLCFCGCLNLAGAEGTRLQFVQLEEKSRLVLPKRLRSNVKLIKSGLTCSLNTEEEKD